MLVSINLLAYDFAVDGIYYNVTSDTTVEVTYYKDHPYNNEYTGSISIPSYVLYNEVFYQVTSIGYNAFHDCAELTTINIPNSVTSIGSYAFWRCSGLSEVTIPSSVTSIGDAAFGFCINLSKVYYNAMNVEENFWNSQGMFDNDSNLTNVYIAENVKTIPQGFLWNCPNVDNIVIPEGVEVIPPLAFVDCKNLTNLTLPSTLTTIKEGAFSGCKSLHLNIPANVDSIDYFGDPMMWHTFDSVITITVDTNNQTYTSIDGSLYSKDSTFLIVCRADVDTFETPFPVVTISDLAFNNARRLKKLTISENVKVLYANALITCDSIQAIDYKAKDMHIEELYGCNVYYSDYSVSNSVVVQMLSYAPWNVDSTGEYQPEIELNIYNSVKNIPFGFMPGTKKFSFLSLPNSIDTTKQYAFMDWFGLEKIVSENPVPPIMDTTVFRGIDKNIAVYVPCGSIDAYKSAEGWKEFQNIQAEGECNEDTTITTPTDPIITDTTINMSVNICAGESYEFYDTILTQSGSYTYTINNSIYGDTIINLDLTVSPTYNKDTLVVAKYTNGAYPLYTEGLTETYNQDGLLIGFTKEDTLQSIYGCDSIIVLMLEIEYSTQNDTLSISICEGETYSFNGQELTESGIYTDTLTSVAGTDSIVTLILKVYQNITKYVTAVICENSSYSFNGDNYSQAGVYTANLKTEKGCDSTVILTLNTLPTYDTTIKATICSNETYTLANQEFNKAGIYQIKLPTVNCCDSNITLILTVLPEITNDIEVSICSGHSYSFAGEELTESGIYYDTIQNEDGCDSVAILHLTVNTAYDTTIVVEIAPDEVYIFNGDTLSTSGTYTAHYYTETNCDSIVTVQLYVKSSLSEIETANSVIIYPNPAKDKVTIEGEGDIIVTNNFGQIVYKTNSPYKTNGTNKPLTMIDVSNWESGIYYVKVGDKTKKLVIE